MYAVFVITAILLSVAPMHAHALIATVMPAGVPARQLDATSPTVRHLAPATRIAARRSTIPSHGKVRPAIAAVQNPSPVPVVLAEAALLAHAPNAP